MTTQFPNPPGISATEITLRWATRLVGAGTAGAALAPVLLSPEAFAACIPPAARSVDLHCLGSAGLGLAAALGVAAGVIGALSAVVRARCEQRAEERLTAAGVHQAVARAIGSAAAEPATGAPVRRAS